MSRERVAVGYTLCGRALIQPLRFNSGSVAPQPELPSPAAMGCFHLDVSYDGQAWSEKAELIEVQSPEVARQEAVEIALRLARQHPSASELVVRVRDETLEPLASIRVSAERSRRGVCLTLQFA